MYKRQLHLLPSQLKALETMGLPVKSLFLDASSDILLRRYSETRRRHPLSGLLSAQGEPALAEAIEAERELLSDLRDQAHVIDTSFLRSAQLQTYVKTFIDTPSAPLTLVFESFAFKRGVPIDADFMFDVRMLPNPYYEAGLRALTGRDAPVQDYLVQSAEVNHMLAHIERFLLEWIPAIERDHRRYVTVAIGCTGGQHRSVYLTEQLASRLSSRWLTLRRHRELDASI